MVQKIVITTLLIVCSYNFFYAQLIFKKSEEINYINYNSSNSTIISNTAFNDTVFESLREPNQLVREPKGVSDKLEIEGHYVFYTAIQSPTNSNYWLCMERTIMGTAFKLYLYNKNVNTKKVIIENKSTEATYAYRPVAWSNNSDVVYIEKIVLDDAYEHEGIFELNLLSGTLKELGITGKYMTTPILMPNKKQFMYLATSAIERDLVHGVADKLMNYTIQTEEETLVSEDLNVPYSILGLYLKESDLSLVSNQTMINPTQINFKLPYVIGKSYCVTRDGSIAPTGPIGSSSSCTNLGPHSYPAALDFDTPNNLNEKVLAVAAGTVTSVLNSGSSGYGKHLIITHADNYRTLYAHFFSIAVTQGQVIQKGCYLGFEGTTGGSSGDHIHLEYEYPGGSGNLYPVFDECNCIPHRGYNYTSGNVQNPCTSTSTVTGGPSNDICSNAKILIPSPSCNNTAGTVENSTPSGLTKPSCDASTSPSLKDVWYKFVATAPSATITLMPSAQMDAVIALYTSCSSSASELNCTDLGGGVGVVEKISSNNLTVGTTYYIRVYDYGTQDPTTSTFNICVQVPITTQLNENEISNSINVYPNPFTKSATLLIENTTIWGDEITIKINDVLGKEAFMKIAKLSANEAYKFEIERGELPSGVYLMSVSNDNNFIVKKIIIE